MLRGRILASLLAGAMLLASIAPARPAFAQGCEIVPLTTPLTSTAYDGNDTIVVGGPTLLETNAVFGVPNTARALLIRMQAQWAAASAGNQLRILPRGVAAVADLLRAYSTDLQNTTFTVPTDANGDLDITVAGANALNVTIQIYGYCLNSFTPVPTATRIPDATPIPTATPHTHVATATANATIPALAAVVLTLASWDATHQAGPSDTPGGPTHTPTHTPTPNTTATTAANQLATLVSWQLTHEATATPTTEPTATIEPTTTATPGYMQSIALTTGSAGLYERRWSVGQLFIGLMLVVLVALLGVRLAYQIARPRAAR